MFSKSYQNIDREFAGYRERQGSSSREREAIMKACITNELLLNKSELYSVCSVYTGLNILIMLLTPPVRNRALGSGGLGYMLRLVLPSPFLNLRSFHRYQSLPKPHLSIRLASTYTNHPNNRSHKYANKKKMGKKKSGPPEELLILPEHPSKPTATIVDTHTHLASTFASYRGKYKEGKHETVYDFVKELYRGKNVEAIVDVWCEAPPQKLWREFADSALTAEDRQTKWGGLEYWFVMGAF
jgi:hypothetical protein